MLIAPHIHCFGLLLAAMLISDVHAMPMDRAKPEVTYYPLEQPRFTFGDTNSMFPTSNSIHSSYTPPPGSPSHSIYSSDAPPPDPPSKSIHSSNTPPPNPSSNSVHSSDAPPPAQSKSEEYEWDFPYRATVLAHTETVLDLTVAPVDPTKLDIDTDLVFGTADRRQITRSIKDAMGSSNLPRSISYTNKLTETVTTLTGTRGLSVFMLEGLGALCKNRPCVGWRMRSVDNGKLIYVSVYQLDKEGKRDPKVDPYRYPKTKPSSKPSPEPLPEPLPEPSPDDWAAYDKQFWARFPSERFADPEWGVLKQSIDRQHKREIDRRENNRNASSGEKRLKEQGRKRKGAPRKRNLGVH